LVVVGRHGNLTPVVDRRGRELVLDRPTSVEFVGATAYVLSDNSGNLTPRSEQMPPNAAGPRSGLPALNATVRVE
jgi:hypothetical protein